jgi:hypothetical protein
LGAALIGAGLTQAHQVWYVDEMRFGLWGQTRRRWGLRGVKIVQRIQITFAWRYLVLAVNCVRGQLQWEWVERVRQQELTPVLERWSLEALVWDSASPHKGRQVAQLGIPLIFLPPYAPELDPAERVFREIRREIEGIVYPSLQAKQAAIEQLLRRLAADRQRLNQLIGWDWIQAAHQSLPVSDTRSI